MRKIYSKMSGDFSSLHNKKHFYTIDYIRSVSAILVLLYHYTFRYNENEYIIDTNSQLDWPFQCSWGYGAVVSFFILSGFLLAKFVEKTDVKPIRFLYKRLLRLYPTFWVSMTLTSVALLFLFPEIRIGLLQYLVNLTMMASTFGFRFIDGAYWTMGYEIKFAIIFALVLCIKRVDIRMWVLIGWVILSIVFSVDKNNCGYFYKFLRVILIVDWVQMFLTGLSIYNIIFKSKYLRLNYILLWCCFINQIIWLNSNVHIIFFVVTCMILLLMPYIEKYLSKCIVNKPIEFIALISYPLYLIHQMIGIGIIREFKNIEFDSEIWIIVPITISFVVAYILHKYVEEPSSRSSFKFWPRLLIRHKNK